MRSWPARCAASATKQHVQTGSHLRLTTTERGEHHLTIPQHNPLKIGTLAGILADVAGHVQISRDELLKKLFK